MSMRILVGLFFLGLCAGACAEPMPSLYTVPNELNMLIESGHIQGATCSERAVYLSHARGVEKIAWDGRRLGGVTAPNHLGDVAYAEGRLYGVIVLYGKLPPDEPVGRIVVWDEDLNLIQEKKVDLRLDGCVVFQGKLYVGVDEWGKDPHAGCTLAVFDLDLNLIEKKTIDLGYWIHYGVQTLATDGESLFLGNYGAKAEDNNPERYNCTRLDAALEWQENLRFSCSEGFALVPASVAQRPGKIFFAVRALGGNMQGWRRDPVGNPPQIRLDFYDYAEGTFRDISQRRE